jgi:outer membrane biogenesis lipoprotein LolB
VDYDKYMQVNGDLMPAHIVLSREGVRVRIVVERWEGLR